MKSHYLRSEGNIVAKIPPISSLPKDQQQQLLDNLNYLNTAEIKSFCKQHSIPYTIAIQSKDGKKRKTNEDDRKGVVLNRIRHFLRTGEILEETCFRGAVVCSDPLPQKITPDHRLCYGHYDKTNRSMMGLLKELTQGKFRDGAIARILAREFWSRGEAPTFKGFALAWLQAVDEHDRPNAEWAYLSDRWNKTAVPDWKKLRTKKAATVIATLRRITAK